MARDVVAVIPARIGSTRFPGKILHLHRGRPLLYYIWNQVSRSTTIDRVVIATDSHEVIELAELFGAEAMRTSSRHRTGSDRVAEVMARIPGSLYINVQADNFGLSGRVLDPVVRWMLAHPREQYGTLARRINSEAALDRTDCTKVVASESGYALWFSRLPVPYVRDHEQQARISRFRYLEHIGVYFFRPAALARFARWKRAACEKAESLEQLRILEHGERIRLFVTRARSVSVDSPQDVKAVESLIQ